MKSFFVFLVTLLICASAYAQQATPIIGLPLAGPTKSTDSVAICQQSGCTTANSLASATLGNVLQTLIVSCTPNVDCSQNINAALAPVGGVYSNVRIPAPGAFLSKPVNLAGGQCLYGDGRGNTTINIDQTFSSTALGVVILTGREQQSPCVYGLAFTFKQPTAPTSTLTAASISGTTLTATVSGGGNPENGNLVYDTTNHILNGTTISGVSVVGNSLTATVSQSQSVSSEAAFTGLGRTQFVALGTCDAVSTGCEYPPAIYIQNSNRFRLWGLQFNASWDSIANAVGNTIGGFFVNDIEDGALDKGINLFSSYDFGHIAQYHSWNFGDSGPLFALMNDGGTIAGIFGVDGSVGGHTGDVDGITIVDWAVLSKRTQVGNSGSWVQFVSPQFDSPNATLEVTGAKWVKLDSPYWSGSSIGSNTACDLNITGGTVYMNNGTMLPSAGGGNAAANICMSNVGSAPQLYMQGGQLQAAGTSLPIIIDSGNNGVLSVDQTRFNTNHSGNTAWTTPVIQVTAAGTAEVQLLNPMMDTAPSGGNVGFITIATDNAQNQVRGNFYGTGWLFAPPGILGDYDWTAKVLCDNGTGWTNTGIGTGEINLTSCAITVMNANDRLRITTLWTSGGTASNTKTGIIRWGTSACTPQASCSTGSTIANPIFNSSSLVSNKCVTDIWNTNSQSAQGSFTATCATVYGFIGGATSSFAVTTSSPTFLNLDGQTNTSSADSIKLVAYTVELIPGR